MTKLKINFVIYLLVLIGLLSCNSKDKYTAPIFKDMGNIIGDTIVSDVMCTYIPNIYIVDSLLVVECINSIDKKAFYIYNKDSGKLLKTFGIYGNGPGELPRIFNHTLDKNKRNLYIIGRESIISFNIDSILLNDNYRFENQVALNSTSNNAWMSFYKDSLFCAMNDMRLKRDYRLAILNSKADIIASYKDMPAINSFDNDSTSTMFFYLLRTLGALRPDGKKFVIVTTCGLNMELFNLDENNIKRTDFIRFIEPKFTGKQPILNDGVMPGIIRLDVSDKYIYGMWSEDTDKFFAEKIVTFDWNGTPLSQYTFGAGMAGGCAIYNDTEVYITIKNSLGQLNIVKYNLPITL